MERINFYYDPSASGYDPALWKVISGNDPFMMDNKLIFNSSECITISQIRVGTLIAKTIIQSAPFEGSSKFIGFQQNNLGVFLGFDITDDVFSCICVNEYGETYSEAVTWRDVWTNTEIELKIVSNNYDAQFYINNERVCVINAGSIVSYQGFRTPGVAMSIGIKNGDTDNLKFSSINMIDVISLFSVDKATNDTSILHVDVSESIASADNVSSPDVDESVSVFETIGVSEDKGVETDSLGASVYEEVSMDEDLSSDPIDLNAETSEDITIEDTDMNAVVVDE